MTSSLRTTVTTSWDDGHVLDLKLAELLRRYDLPGTFYVAPDNHEITLSNRLTPEQIITVGESFEIGSHTITHPRLTEIDDAAARHEITASKAVLEKIIGRPVATFCYPGGDYSARHLTMVSDAGYTYARTVKRFHHSRATQPLAAPTSLHAYRHWSDTPAIARFAGFRPLLTAKYLRNWDDLAIAQFDRVRSTGGVFHLWGHSWEIDAHSDWPRLERVFSHISRHPDVTYSTNGQMA